MVYITIINETNYKILFQPTKMVINYDKIGDHSFDTMGIDLGIEWDTGYCTLQLNNQPCHESGVDQKK